MLSLKVDSLRYPKINLWWPRANRLATLLPAGRNRQASAAAREQPSSWKWLLAAAEAAVDTGEDTPSPHYTGFPKPSMSRLIVRNLPKHLTVQRLKEHFERQGEVTDARIMKTRDGRSRLFGFVGFKTASDANQARAHFNGTYIDTSRVQVDVAVKGGDDSLARSWSKHTSESKRGRGRTLRDLAQGGHGNQADPQAAARRRRQTAVSIDMDANTDTAKLLQLVNSDDPKFKEFVEAHASRAQGPVWGDGQRVAATKRRRATVRVASVQSKKAGGDAAPLLQKTHVTFGDESSDDELYEDARGGETDVPQPDTSQPAFDAGLDDFAWLQSKVVSGTGADDTAANNYSGNSDSDNEDGTDGGRQKYNASATSSTVPFRDSTTKAGRAANVPGSGVDVPADTQSTLGGKCAVVDVAEVGVTGRLFVRNLPYTATEDELEAYFQAWGQLSEVHIVRVRETKASKGYAYVQYILPQHAIRALDQADGSIFQGRLLHVLPAAMKEIVTEHKHGAASTGEGGSYKHAQQQEQRKDAEKQHNWNSLFLNSNAVADSMAARLAVDKADVLGREATGSSAVRLALGETQALSETKQLLEDEGISSRTGTQSTSARSNTAVLVKNIPFSTTEADLIQLFEQTGGPIARVVLPASKTLALVECVEPADAKRAFRKLAYKKFKGTPLFLEWAPLAAQEAARQAVPDAIDQDVAVPGPPQPQGVERDSATLDASAKQIHGETKAGEDDTEQDDAQLVGGMDERTLFVKNVNFKTSEEELKHTFESVMGHGTVRSCTLPKKTAKLRGKPNVKLPTVRCSRLIIRCSDVAWVQCLITCRGLAKPPMMRGAGIWLCGDVQCTCSSAGAAPYARRGV